MRPEKTRQVFRRPFQEHSVDLSVALKAAGNKLSSKKVFKKFSAWLTITVAHEDTGIFFFQNVPLVCSLTRINFTLIDEISS